MISLRLSNADHGEIKWAKNLKKNSRVLFRTSFPMKKDQGGPLGPPWWIEWGWRPRSGAPPFNSARASRAPLY